MNMQLIVLFVSGKSVFQKGRAIDTGEVEIGAQVMQTIPPGLFWRFQITIHHPMYLKFNISLAKDSLLGIYGRRNIPPTHTQVIRNNTNSIMLTIFKQQRVRMFTNTFKAGREEGTGCKAQKAVCFPFFYWGLATPRNHALSEEGTVSYRKGQQLWPPWCDCPGGWTGTRCAAVQLQHFRRGGSGMKYQIIWKHFNLFMTSSRQTDYIVSIKR